MTASIESPSKRGQFLDRFLAFFAGAALAVWFLGGLSSSNPEAASLAGPETQLVSALTSESTTILTRMSEELIVQVASTFEAPAQNAPFATIGKDGQVRVLSVDELSKEHALSAGTSESGESSSRLISGQVRTRNTHSRLELVSSANRTYPSSVDSPARRSLGRPVLTGAASQKSLESKMKKGQQRDGPKRSHPLLA